MSVWPLTIGCASSRTSFCEYTVFGPIYVFNMGRKKNVLSFCLLMTICCSTGLPQVLTPEMNKTLVDLFGTADNPLISSKGQSSDTSPSAQQLSLNPSSSSGARLRCDFEDGSQGVCVLYYQCGSDQNVINDGNGLIDLRQQECRHSLEVCCHEETVSHNVTAIPPAKPRPGATATPIPVTPGSVPSITPYPGYNPNIEVEQCGYSNPGANAFRIVSDGTSADYGEFPWMVALLKRSSTAVWTQSDYLGGGSIIHPSVVLTGAHKVDNFEASQIKCRAGEWDTQTDKEIYPHQERNVRKIVKHDGFYRPSVYNSVALLFLESPYDFTDAPHMGIACVGRSLPPPGSSCYSMGWGKEFNEKDKYAVVLKKVELKTKSSKQCQDALRRTRLGSFFKLHPSLTCAGGEDGKDTCSGDGGSPLVCPIGHQDPNTENIRYAVFGMVAYGIGCGTEGVPGVYVNVPSFYEWISQSMIAEKLPTTTYAY